MVTTSTLLDIRKRMAGGINIIDDADGMIEVAISTDAPIMMPWGESEILSHEEGAIDLGRVEGRKAPILLNHRALPLLGIWQSAEVRQDGELKKLYLRGAFDLEDPDAAMWFRKIKDGFVNTVSVGWRPSGMNAFRVVGDSVIITRWELMEGSITSEPPADPNSGISEARSSYQAMLNSRHTRGDLMPEDENTQTAVITEPSPEQLQAAANDAIAIERQRSADITALGEKMNNRELAQQLIKDGAGLLEAKERFYDWSMENRSSQQPEGEPPSEFKLGLSERENQKYSLQRAFNAAAYKGEWGEGSGLEQECSNAIADKLGVPRSRVFIPASDLTISEEFMREMRKRKLMQSQRTATAFDTTNAENIDDLIDCDLRTGDICLLAYEMSLLARLGVRRFPNQTASPIIFPEQTVGTDFYWVNECQDIPETSLEFGSCEVKPCFYATLMTWSTQADWFGQSLPGGYEGMARFDLARSRAKFLDESFLSGLGSTNPCCPRGLLNTPGLQTLPNGCIGPDGGALTCEHIEYIVGQIEDLKRCDRDDLSILTNRDTARYLASLKDADGRVLWDESCCGGMLRGYPDMLKGMPFMHSCYVPNNLTKGAGTDLSAMIIADFSTMAMFEWYGLEIMTSDHYGFGSGCKALRVQGSVNFKFRKTDCIGVINDIDTTIV